MKCDLWYLLRARNLSYGLRSSDRHGGYLISDLRVSPSLFPPSGFFSTNCYRKMIPRASFARRASSRYVQRRLESGLRLMGKLWPRAARLSAEIAETRLRNPARFIIARCDGGCIVRMHRTLANSERSPTCYRPPTARERTE